MIYLDHAATTPTDPRVIDAMAVCMRECWVNPSAPYAAAGAARRQLRLARRTVADMLGASPQEILFTSGGSEANTQALTLARGGHAVVSAIEHASVLNAARALCAEVTLVPPGADGRVPPEAVAAALRPDTRLISVQFANNETGVLQDVPAIGALARARRVWFHCDAVQAFGHVPVDVRACAIDLLTLAAHKFFGPRGAGCLYARQGTPLTALIHGGGQEFGLRAGTENVAAVCGLRVAAELARDGLTERQRRERALMDAFLGEMRRGAPECRVLGESAPRLPGLVALLLPGVPSEAAIARLDGMGVAVSGGAACASRERAISHVYRAMGLSEADARCVLRVSLSHLTGEDDLARAAQAILRVYRECRA